MSKSLPDGKCREKYSLQKEQYRQKKKMYGKTLAWSWGHREMVMIGVLQVLLEGE